MNDTRKVTVGELQNIRNFIVSHEGKHDYATQMLTQHLKRLLNYVQFLEEELVRQPVETSLARTQELNVSVGSAVESIPELPEEVL